jgi:DNA gyrase/topoisomerase IV subunit A
MNPQIKYIEYLHELNNELNNAIDKYHNENKHLMKLINDLQDQLMAHKEQLLIQGRELVDLQKKLHRDEICAK